jgi:ADP-ribose pyrophosphatase
MADPEVTIGVVREHQGKRIKVRLERIRLADGSETQRDIVLHPDSVVIAAVDGEGQVLLVRQYRKATGKELVELPAGVMEAGETPLEAALRELREETGHTAARMTHLGSFYSAPGTMTECLHAFLAQDIAFDPLPADDDERIEVERMPFERAVARARQGAFEDAKTLAALFLAAPRVGVRLT